MTCSFTLLVGISLRNLPHLGTGIVLTVAATAALGALAGIVLSSRDQGLDSAIRPCRSTWLEEPGTGLHLILPRPSHDLVETLSRRDPMPKKPGGQLR